jgi:hypothetical protein
LEAFLLFYVLLATCILRSDRPTVVYDSQYGPVTKLTPGSGQPSTPVIRYSFYFFKLLGSVPYVITWMRYTFFIALYPIGVSSELFLAYSGFEHIKVGAVQVCVWNHKRLISATRCSVETDELRL